MSSGDVAYDQLFSVMKQNITCQVHSACDEAFEITDSLSDLHTFAISFCFQWMEVKVVLTIIQNPEKNKHLYLHGIQQSSCLRYSDGNNHERHFWEFYRFLLIVIL